MSRIAPLFRAVSFSIGLVLATTVPVSADLVGWWNFDDEEALDLSGNENDGVDNGVLYSEDTYDGEGFSLEIFPNTNVQVPPSDSLDINDTMTIAFWMKADNDVQSANWNGPMSKSLGDEPNRLGWEFQRWENQSRLDIRVDTDAGQNSVRGNVTNTYDDEWVHVAWTLDEGEYVSFLDGQLVEIGTYPHGSGFGNDQASLYIGCRVGPWCAFEGLLDDIGIWDEVLDDEAIEALADGESPIGPPGGKEGDYNGDDVLDATDIDLQSVEMKKPAAEQDLATFDHNNDGVINVGEAGPDQSKWGDRLIWIRSLRKTSVGDVDFNNVFDSGDLVLALSGAKYGSGEMATWVQGDWNGDMRFDSGDLVLAFQDGGYVAGGVAAVPEPSSLVLVLIGALLIVRRSRR